LSFSYFKKVKYIKGEFEYYFTMAVITHIENQALLSAKRAGKVRAAKNSLVNLFYSGSSGIGSQ
jgi:hypothetical protein